MSDFDPRNNIPWRVQELERKVQALVDGKPELVADRLATLTIRVNDLKTEMKEEIAETRNEVRQFKRIFISVFTGVGISIAAAVVALIITGGNP